MLTGYACQQAKAMGLPFSGDVTSSSREESRQRRLCLFWALFIIDKSCALAFGRPAFLRAAEYRSVPEPDLAHLLSFNPHGTRSRQQHGQEVPGPTFGAHVFLQYIKLARLTDDICSLFVQGGSEADIDDIKLDLDRWFAQTKTVGPSHGNPVHDKRVLTHDSSSSLKLAMPRALSLQRSSLARWRWGSSTQTSNTHAS
jgi:hypothetical protein